MTLLVAAMEDEVKDILPLLMKVEEKPFLTFEGRLGKKDVVLILTGIGKSNAAAAVSFAITKYQPLIDLIINIGIAGGYQVLTYTPYVVSAATYSDFDLRVFKYELGQVPKMPTWFKLDHSLESKLSEYHKAELYSADHFGTSPIKEAPHLVDMEGAAVFQVAHIFEIPLISIKVVSDLIGDKNQLETYKESEVTLSDVIKDTLFDLMEVLS
ncbi:5'-methylthioadenosine/S-adenosylhomocysteine nucleosidase [Acholeplasma equirhinis]|uniref:5'-methylthioadenosine/S-adenosylhomocysteine nucleosidase family protein n=1 Tax=Acholeplasma equirhinis TaxID=555393 RepID=UPI00197A8E9A|nr:5'-methylthioadenosine/S-adenosylhomocysteine nucleosidase [Acholeplasma equirhinis]MBN3491234.1 5'-methylthioadenosine/S-adenosylhomocysteine nucleosidase [Acholeplasma equirhinis]